jgi:hypothetical protein
MIDLESERAVTGWLRLGDRLTGRKPVQGRCERCGESRYLTEVDMRRLCARCSLARVAAET